MTPIPRGKKPEDLCKPPGLWLEAFKVGKKDEIQGAAGRIQGDEICESTGKLTLRESNIEPARKPFFNRKVVFQPSIFRCYVSFRELLEVLVVKICWKIPSPVRMVSYPACGHGHPMERGVWPGKCILALTRSNYPRNIWHISEIIISDSSWVSSLAVACDTESLGVLCIRCS